MIELSRRGRFLPIIAAIVVGMVLFVVYRAEHVHFSPQSRQGAIAARSLLDRGSFELHPGKPYAAFGPLYPVLLAGLGMLRFPLADSIGVINSAALGLSLLTFFWIARESGFQRPGLLTAFYSALAINPYLFRMARADGIFVFACMLTVYGLARFASEGGRRHLAIAALGCVLASTARYMGIFALGPLCLWVIVALRRPGSRREWIDAAAFFVVAWTPVLLWLLRNKTLTGYFAGMSRESWSPFAAPWSPLTNLLSVLRTLAFDFLGVRVMGVVQVVRHGNFTPHRELTNAVLGVLAACFLAAFLWMILHRGQARRKPGAEMRIHSGLIHMTGLFIAVYSGALLVLWSWGNNDPIHTRFVAPIEWAIALYSASLWVRLRENPAARPLRKVMLATAIVILAVNVDKSIRLFGKFPGEELIQKDIQQGAYAWIRNPIWEREAMFAPVNMKKRVVDE